jgi:hypothetical protein
LGDPVRAEKLLMRAVAGHDGRYARNRVLYRVRLARSRLDMRAAEGAAEAADRALDDLTGQVASWRVEDELSKVAGQLVAYAQEPQVSQFLTRYSAVRRQSRSSLS